MSTYYGSSPTPSSTDSEERVVAEDQWDADDECSDMEDSADPFDNFSSMHTALPEPQAIFKFHVCRSSQPTLGTNGKSEGWANTSYLLWELCAILADAGTDVKWTKKFEKWRPTWQKIQTRAKTYGYTHFSSEIPLAPVDLAIVKFNGGDRSFEIEQGDHGDGQDQLDVWALWRFVIEMPVVEMSMFEVTLMDEV